MNTSDETFDELREARELIHALCDDHLPPAGHARLEALMLESAEARTLYLEILRLHAALHQRTARLQPSRGSMKQTLPKPAG